MGKSDTKNQSKVENIQATVRELTSKLNEVIQNNQADDREDIE